MLYFKNLSISIVVLFSDVKVFNWFEILENVVLEDRNREWLFSGSDRKMGLLH